MEQDPRDPWIGTAEVAPILGVSDSQVRILIRTGRLAPAIRHTTGRGKWLVRASTCARYLAEREAPATATAA